MTICLILSSFGLTFSQTVKESLPDGSFIIELEGKEYRALPPEKIKEILLLKATNNILTEESKTFHSQFDLYRETVKKQMEEAEDLKKSEMEKEHKEAMFWMGQYSSEKALREKYQKNLTQCTGKIVFFRLCNF